ncbi:Fis family transcriptional regulator [Pseudomonas taeanensis MS-3]|jgi:two-component system chemotaxis response regulator CheY|uniref:Fis family transcriptional regulator n=1 Tax=Pseudomonas taeanensis MS-3 TaxID=1395571 RepID=A0A0A1YKZ7_9PSED|nr:response regulator [Pseudomonas taeanensis]KFX70580.1 Fis family transcriptional regulator [Pseudomonas taeanensis MS-3]
MNKSILIVDDSASIRQMLGFTLRSAGYDVDEAVDGKDGLGKAQRKSYQLVFTDQNMPNMDGLSLIKSLRGLPNYRGTPILMLTTESTDAMKQQGKAAGATGWLVKPFDPPKLLEVTKKVLP